MLDNTLRGYILHSSKYTPSGHTKESRMSKQHNGRATGTNGSQETKASKADGAQKGDAVEIAGGREGEGVEGPGEQESEAVQECCHHKQTPRSIEFQSDLQKRLNRAIGQLNGVKGMLDDNRYCGDVLVQLAAAESAIRSISSMLLQDHLETCVVEQIRQGNDEVIEEVMQLMKRFSR